MRFADFFDIINVSAIGPAPCPRLKLRERIGRSLSNKFNAPIAAVSNPAGEAELKREISSLDSEENALNSPADDDM